MIKKITILVVCCVMFGCASSVKTDPVHGKLLGSWKLIVGSYIVRYDDAPQRLLIVPCVEKNYVYMPGWEWRFDKHAVGRRSEGEEIIAVLENGTIFTVIDVLRDNHPTMGVSYHPIVMMEEGTLASRNLDGNLLYRGFYEVGTLNPIWTNPVGPKRPR